MSPAEINRRLSFICRCVACQRIERLYLERVSLASDVAEADNYYAELKARLDERAPA